MAAIVRSASRRQTVVLEASQVDQFSSLSKIYNKTDHKLMIAMHNRLHHHSLKASNASHVADELTLVTPLHVFVASDDANVTRAAARLNYMTLPEGTSQATAGQQMAHLVIADPERGFNATLEIISDIYFLSQCR